MALMRDGCMCVCVEHWSMIQMGKNQNTGRKSHCIANFYTINPKWIGMESNLGLRGDRLNPFDQFLCSEQGYTANISTLGTCQQ